MICIGLAAPEKQAAVDRYLAAEPGINRVVVFHPEVFPLPLELPTHLSVQYVEYKDIIMYKTFYPLLEVIDPNTLLVFNECMRTQNRSDLTYNCAHHYCNQTPHKLIFEHFPFIDDSQNFMILLDLQNKGRYKGKGFDYGYLADEAVRISPQRFTVGTIDVAPTAKEVAKYEAKKKQLFDGLGQGDPDTIPRQLHVFAGGFKRSAVHPAVQYVARNDRFKLPNVATYRDQLEPGEYSIIDFPHRRIDFNDFLKRTGTHRIQFIHTRLPVDRFYLGDLQSWIDRLEAFYAAAGVRP